MTQQCQKGENHQHGRDDEGRFTKAQAARRGGGYTDDRRDMLFFMEALF